MAHGTHVPMLTIPSTVLPEIVTVPDGLTSQLRGIFTTLIVSGIPQVVGVPATDTATDGAGGGGDGGGGGGGSGGETGGAGTATAGTSKSGGVGRYDRGVVAGWGLALALAVGLVAPWIV